MSVFPTFIRKTPAAPCRTSSPSITAWAVRVQTGDLATIRTDVVDLPHNRILHWLEHGLCIGDDLPACGDSLGGKLDRRQRS